MKRIYEKHEYSGARPNAKKSRAALRRYHGVAMSRSEVWRIKEPINKAAIYRKALQAKVIKTYARVPKMRVGANFMGSATIEHGVEEPSRTEMAIKTEVEDAVKLTPYDVTEMNLNNIKDEPGLVELVKTEPALLVKEELVEDGWQGTNQQSTCIKCVKNFASKLSCQRHKNSGKCSRPSASNKSAMASTTSQQHRVVLVKEEPADGELELGSVVFQHMDCNYRPYEEEP